MSFSKVPLVFLFGCPIENYPVRVSGLLSHQSASWLPRRHLTFSYENCRDMCGYALKASSSADGDCGNIDSFDDGEEGQTPYGNRSLSWTNTFRKLIPYEFAREAALQLGLRSKEDWDEGIENGEIFQGPYLPSKPNEMYPDDWVSWEEFLGICRTYDESRQLIKDVLKFGNMNE